MSVQAEPVEEELVEEVREIREEVSGPSHGQLLRRGLLIGGPPASSGRSATGSRGRNGQNPERVHTVRQRDD